MSAGTNANLVVGFLNLDNISLDGLDSQVMKSNDSIALFLVVVVIAVEIDAFERSSKLIT